MIEATIGFVVGITIGLVLLIIGVCASNDDWRDSAAKHHAAEYYLDANNERQWHWLDEPKKP